MKIQEAEKLLAKFYKGETSVAEEDKLKKFFSEPGVPEHLKPDQDIFSYYSGSGSDARPGTELEKNILQAIRESDTSYSTGPGRFTGQLYWITGIAATILIVIGSYFLFQRGEETDTFNNPELAYLETKKVLYFVSSKLNAGTNPIQQTLKKFDKGTSELKKMSELNKGIEELRAVTHLPAGFDALYYLEMLQEPGDIVSKYIK